MNKPRSVNDEDFDLAELGCLMQKHNAAARERVKSEKCPPRGHGKDEEECKAHTLQSLFLPVEKGRQKETKPCFLTMNTTQVWNPMGDISE